jgi:hypothetical protein
VILKRGRSGMRRSWCYGLLGNALIILELLRGIFAVIPRPQETYQLVRKPYTSQGIA